MVENKRSKSLIGNQEREGSAKAKRIDAGINALRGMSRADEQDPASHSFVESTQATFKQQLSLTDKKGKAHRKEIKKFKRLNKHSPKEISSKIPASKIKKISFLKPGEDAATGTYIKKEKSRDPRFDKFSGHFNQGLFEASYSFLDENKEEELRQLGEALQNSSNPEEKEKLRRIYLKKKQEITRDRDTKRELKVKRELMKKERDKVKEGKKSFFLKKGLIKQLARDEKITELKETGEYEEYSRKKRKREISYEKSKLFSLPTKRRSE